MNDLQRVLNADDIAYYNTEYRPHLVQGQFKSEFQHAEDLRKTCTIDIHYDQAFTRRLRSSINKREIWSIPGKGDCFITANNSNALRYEAEEVSLKRVFKSVFDH